MSYDLVIIGSGPGGYSAAVRAGQYGLKTAIIEKDPKLGGTCLHVGCIPTKALLHSADVWDYFKHSADEGIFCENPRIDFPLISERKNKIVAKHAKGVEGLMKKNKVEWLKGYGKYKGPRQSGITAADGSVKTLDTKFVMLATGSVARMLPGLQADPQFILTNIEILNLTAVPKTLGIIGAGAVGVEFASIFARFGSKVTLLEMLPRIVPVEDEDVSKELDRVFRKQGIRVETGAKAENIQRTGSSVKLTATLASGKKEDMEFDSLLIAVGRKPNTDNIGIEGSKVELDRGFVKVDGYQHTGEPECLRHRRHCRRHSATGSRRHDGGHGRPEPYDRPPGDSHQPQPHSGCYIHRAGIGSVGLTEAQAKAQGFQVKVGQVPVCGNSKATILGHHDGFVKVVADQKYGEILGVHIIGPKASN